ncbi:MAG: RAMP superfamily CRISPR-associated protein [Armatimonadetes bacterium]|nr:RAMP superfamily CRISPR-associated protein [Armatimonadota bacterium]MDW8122432.1 RAMP superfamily CRISPR-associated protein [Armatimonadota bacterium]
MRQRQQEPKPFCWICLPQQSPQKTAPVTLDRFTNLTGKLDFSIKVASDYLFVGSGDHEFKPDSHSNEPDVWRTFFRVNGKIAIPGASIKGAIRSIVEAISNSCVLHGERTGSYHQRCIAGGPTIQNWQLCPACRIFGTTGLAGRVSFGDAYLTSETNTEVVKIGELWSPSRSCLGRKFYIPGSAAVAQNNSPERNFIFVEAVPKNAVFCSSLRFQNLQPAELGLLIIAMGWSTDGTNLQREWAPKIGGAKPRCFGSVWFDFCQLHLMQEQQNRSLATLAAQGLMKILSGADMETELVRFINEANRELIHQESRTDLKNLLSASPGRSCPGGMY